MKRTHVEQDDGVWCNKHTVCIAQWGIDIPGNCSDIGFRMGHITRHMECFREISASIVLQNILLELRACMFVEIPLYDAITEVDEASAVQPQVVQGAVNVVEVHRIGFPTAQNFGHIYNHGRREIRVVVLERHTNEILLRCGVEWPAVIRVHTRRRCNVGNKLQMVWSASTR